MLPNWVQSAMEMPVLVHWFMNCWPLLLVAVGEAAVVVEEIDVFWLVVVDVVVGLEEVVVVVVGL